MTHYWLSFTDDTRPEGDQLLGVAIVEADDQEDAVATAWEHGCNPGGQVLILDLTAGGELDPVADLESPVHQYGTNRLIPPAELLAAGEHKVKDLPPEDAWVPDAAEGLGIASHVDAGCNEERG